MTGGAPRLGGWVETAPRLGWTVMSAEEVPAGDGWLSAAERGVLGGMRIEKRRRDYRLGRWTARQAIRAYLREGGLASEEGILAAEAVEIVAAADGAPEVRAAGAAAPVGVSIAHAGGRALAVVGPRGAVFGGDLETVEPRSAGLVEDFFTASERAWVLSLGEEGLSWGASLIWSAKEAVLKALRVGLREDTRAVEVHVLGGVGAPDRASRWWPVEGTVAAGGRRFQGFWRLREGQVLAVLAERTGAPPRA